MHPLHMLFGSNSIHKGNKLQFHLLDLRLDKDSEHHMG
jgi:hypothetical protein